MVTDSWSQIPFSDHYKEQVTNTDVFSDDPRLVTDESMINEESGYWDALINMACTRWQTKEV